MATLRGLAVFTGLILLIPSQIPTGAAESAEVSDATQRAYKALRTKPKSAQSLQEATELVEPALKSQAEELQKRQAEQKPKRRDVSRAVKRTPPADSRSRTPQPAANIPDSAEAESPLATEPELPLDSGPATRELVFKKPGDNSPPETDTDTSAGTRLIEYPNASKRPKPSPKPHFPNDRVKR